MIESTKYVPCLRWKQGEYQSVMRLAPEMRSRLLPLIEVPEIGYDFETQTLTHTLDEHLEPFPKRVADKWGKDRCLVDIGLVDGPDAKMNDEAHPATYIFTVLQQLGVSAVPVLRLSQESRSLRHLSEMVHMGSRGMCLRLSLVEATSVSVGQQIDDLLAHIGERSSNCDLVLDLEAPNFDPIEGFAGLLVDTIRCLPRLDSWRTLTLLGTSFPSTMAEVSRGLSRIERKEWLLYHAVVDGLTGLGERTPQFGDYAIAHPAVVQIDFRKVTPAASVRYAAATHWLIAKGQSDRHTSREQYRALCRSIVGTAEYDGPDYCAGDRHIFECAAGTGSTGSLSTWRWVGTNRHLTKVVRTLSS